MTQPDTIPTPPEVERTEEKVENKPAYVPLLLWQGAAPIYVPFAEYEDIAALIKGERGLMRAASEPEVRRILDLGANVGEFAIACRLRFPYAWVDCVEDDTERLPVCRSNVPAGTRVKRMLDDPLFSGYDLVRVTKRYDFTPEDDPRTRMMFFDGVKRMLPDPWVLVAMGMRRKNEPWSWWVRPEVSP